MKWCVIGFDFSTSRYEFLSEWLKKQGVENQVDFIEASPSEYLQKLDELKKNYDQIRIERPLRHEVYLETKKNEAKMLLIRTADCFYKDPLGSWWLRSPLYDGMSLILGEMGKNLKLDGAALIVGAGGAARASIAALVKVGYQNFNITSTFDDQVTELISELRKIYFDVTFQFVSSGQLVLLPGTNSIVVNATPMIESNDLLDELHYFNFLVPKGMVWELTLDPIETPLTSEAVEIGARVFRGYEFTAASDWIWLKWVLPDNSFSREVYKKDLKKFIEKQSKASEK